MKKLLIFVLLFVVACSGNNQINEDFVNDNTVQKLVLKNEEKESKKAPIYNNREKQDKSAEKADKSSDKNQEEKLSTSAVDNSNKKAKPKSSNKSKVTTNNKDNQIKTSDSKVNNKSESKPPVAHPKDDPAPTVESMPENRPESKPNKEKEEKHTDNEDIPNNSKDQNLEKEVLCENSFYDDSKACDYIHPNMIPKDELNRNVPSFKTREEAWAWGEQEILNEKSEWYLCGYTVMEGYYNDHTMFYFAYMKACPS